MMKSCTRTDSGFPAGRSSLPLFLKSPTSSFFLVSTEIAGCWFRNCRLTLRLRYSELGVAVRVTRTFSGFAVGLQTVSEIVQQIRDHAVARFMPHAPQLSRQFAKALA